MKTPRAPFARLRFESPGDFAAAKSLENLVSSARFSPR